MSQTNLCKTPKQDPFSCPEGVFYSPYATILACCSSDRLAQWLEHVTSKLEVVGSIPTLSLFAVSDAHAIADRTHAIFLPGRMTASGNTPLLTTPAGVVTPVHPPCLEAPLPVTQTFGPRYTLHFQTEHAQNSLHPSHVARLKVETVSTWLQTGKETVQGHSLGVTPIAQLIRGFLIRSCGLRRREEKEWNGRTAGASCGKAAYFWHWARF